MNVTDLTEPERHQIEGQRILAQSDPAFELLPQIRADRDRIMIDRGARLNGNKSTLADQVFYMGDQSAFHAAFRPLVRCKKVMAEGGPDIPDKAIKDRIDDATNYLDIWACLRAGRKQNGD